jgi:hypothetical protein
VRGVGFTDDDAAAAMRCMVIDVTVKRATRETTEVDEKTSFTSYSSGVAKK